MNKYVQRTAAFFFTEIEEYLLIISESVACIFRISTSGLAKGYSFRNYRINNYLKQNIVTKSLSTIQAMTPESVERKRDTINVNGIYKHIRTKYHDFFGGEMLKLYLITPPIQHVIKECLSQGLIRRVSKCSTVPHSYIATAKGMDVDTLDIFPYNLLSTLSDLKLSARGAGSSEQATLSALTALPRPATWSSSSGRAEGNDSNGARRMGTESSRGSSVDLDMQESLPGHGMDREGDRVAENEWSLKGNMGDERGLELDLESDGDIATQIVWLDQDEDEGQDEEPNQRQRQVQSTPEKTRLIDKGEYLKNKDISRSAAGSKSSEKITERDIFSPSFFSDERNKKSPSSLEPQSAPTERNPYFRYCGAFGLRTVLEAIRVRLLLFLITLRLSLFLSSTLYLPSSLSLFFILCLFLIFTSSPTQNHNATHVIIF